MDRRGAPCSYKLNIREEYALPPIEPSIEFSSALIKGMASSGVVQIQNTSTAVQQVQLKLKRDQSKYILNGVLDCDITVMH